MLDLNSVTPGPPWILVTDHKSGQRSRDCVIRNNLTTALNVSRDAHTSDHNLLLPADLVGSFVDPAHLDIHLATGSPAVDQGSSIQAPTVDVNEVPRPQGAGFDVGAHEFVP